MCAVQNLTPFHTSSTHSTYLPIFDKKRSLSFIVSIHWHNCTQTTTLFLSLKVYFLVAGLCTDLECTPLCDSSILYCVRRKAHFLKRALSQQNISAENDNKALGATRYECLRRLQRSAQHVARSTQHVARNTGGNFYVL